MIIVIIVITRVIIVIIRVIIVIIRVIIRVNVYITYFGGINGKLDGRWVIILQCLSLISKLVKS